MELLSAIMKDAEAPNIEIEVEDCEEYTATFSFYVLSGSNLSQVHMVVENLGATEASQLKEDVTSYERQRHLRRRCEGRDRSPGSNRRMTMSGDTLGEGVWAMI